MIFKQHDIDWNHDKASKIWDYYASNSAYRTQYFGYLAAKQVVQLLKRKAHLNHHGNILDFACGQGDIIGACLPHLNNKQKIYGLDFSKDTVNITNERFRNSDFFAGIEQFDGKRSKYKDNTFDLIIATEIIEHLSDQDLHLVATEWHRLLRVGGTIFITTPNNENLDASKVLCPECGCIFHRWQHIRTWNSVSLTSFLSNYRITPTDVRGVTWGNIVKRMAYLIRGLQCNGFYYIGQKQRS